MEMQKSEHTGLRTWIEIDTKAIRSNYRAFRKFIPKKVKIMGVVKSNAYGHNLTEFALELEKCGVDMLAVDSLVEALSLRKAGIKKEILVLGYTLPEMFSKAAGKKVHLTISSIDGLKVFLKSPSAEKIPVHLKVDTGMHRQGFLLSEIDEVLKLVSASKVRVTGLYTHFASAKDPRETKFTECQIAEFEVWRSSLSLWGYQLAVHAGATGGSSYFPEAHFDMVRIGAGLYGFWQTLGNVPLKPVLTWKTIISEIKEIPAGAHVGYDTTYTTEKLSRIAVCPIGYWHGYPRALSNNSEVLIRGARAKILGRISMDMIVIDVTNIPKIKMGDEVVLIGREGKEEITAADIAEWADTSAYEILTRLNPLIKRIYK